MQTTITQPIALAGTDKIETTGESNAGRAMQRRCLDTGEASSRWDRVQLCQLVERQFCFAIRQREANNHVLTAELSPKPLRGPFLRLGSAQTLDPNKIPLRHLTRPRNRSRNRSRVRV